jgi:hypothetical protein
MMSAALGRPERRNDSELPAQSWNSSQTSVGFGFVSIASAIADAIDFGSASTEAITPQKLRNWRRETPRLSSSSLVRKRFGGPCHRRPSLASDRLVWRCNQAFWWQVACR